ncbi:MAG: hypothetical protein COA66_07220 [Arcobacter sp.]|nr:MAG: hypothetical protein COA66_07220 [Arcobacter sp.]
MKYENLITQLCEVIKESEVNGVEIYDKLEQITSLLDDCKIPMHIQEKFTNLISDSMGLIQHQDLHRQKIERVVNTVCELNDIDSSQYNLAASAKHLSGDDTEDLVSDDDIEELIKQMAK